VYQPRKLLLSLFALCYLSSKFMNVREIEYTIFIILPRAFETAEEVTEQIGEKLECITGSHNFDKGYSRAFRK